MSNDKPINIIGLGYIGLPTALSFAANGIKIIGTDYNQEIVDKLNNGEITFKEEGLEKLFEEAVSKGIQFTDKYVKTNAYIITVPTPYIKESKKLDPIYIINAVENVLDVCEKGTILIIESTVSPGSIDKHIRPIIKKRNFKIGEDIHLVHAPERIIPGNMIYELINNSRTIGVDDIDIGCIVKSWYKSFCKAEITITSIKTAELSKVVENTFRDVNIAFANELMRICRSENIDVYELINICNKHPRVNILNPSAGVGGHCISVDPWFLIGDYPDIVNVIKSARLINSTQPEFVINRIIDIMKKNKINNFEKVGFYGLTYKENVDDIRESPTLQVFDKLRENYKYNFKLYDPMINKKYMQGQYLDFEEFMSDIDMLVIMVRHDHIIQNLDIIENKVILDTCNIVENAYKL